MLRRTDRTRGSRSGWLYMDGESEKVREQTMKGDRERERERDNEGEPLSKNPSESMIFRTLPVPLFAARLLYLATFQYHTLPFRTRPRQQVEDLRLALSTCCF